MNASETFTNSDEDPIPIPDVSIIIVNWNLGQVLRECLESVERHSGGLLTETIVVDNASRDGSPEMVESKFPGVKLLRNNENVGFSRANNQGMRVARGRYIFLLNSDAVVAADALSSLVAFMDENMELGVCGPRVVNVDGTLQVRARGRYPSIATAAGHFLLPRSWRQRVPLISGIYDDEDYAGPRMVDWLSGCALMARREAVESVGMLDAEVFMYCEDVDWCYRMRLGGWKVCYLPAARVMHYGGLSMKQQQGKIVAAHARGLAAFYGKHHGKKATVIFKSVLWLGYSMKAAGWIIEALVGTSSGGMDKLRRLFKGRNTG
ncbi:N-acetylglucosaminyl-diphospho-decaprenol L-rhamnosyltransferase [bacterium BMS3Abin01]|nr:N-acetylglucosaminyl-diphospho-decaprenol L-rhamnosyltransferase [bacterium BMS3Abin01]